MWKQMLPAKEQVRQNEFLANQGRSRQAAATSNMPSSSTAADNSDEDEIVVAEQLTLDQVIEVSHPCCRYTCKRSSNLHLTP